MKQFEVVVKSICSILVLLVLFTSPAVAQTITQIIDETGDGTNFLKTPRGITVDHSGNVYVSGFGYHGFNVFKITPEGEITKIIGPEGDGTNALDTPYRVAVDGDGNVYVAGFLSHNAFKITSNRVIGEIIDSNGDGRGNTLSKASGIAVDGSGNVYVTGFASNNAFRITEGGMITEIIDNNGDKTGNNQLVNPDDIAVDSNGNVYLTGVNSDNAFKITLDADGNVADISEIISAPTSGINAPYGIDVDSSGDVYVACASSSNAFRITSAGVITKIIDSVGDGSNSLSQALDIAFDGPGNVYVTGGLSDNAFKIDTYGCITEIINANGDNTNYLDGPWGIDVDGSGNICVTGAASNNVFKIVLDLEGPRTSNVAIDPVPVNEDALAFAYVDDSTTGGSLIAGASYFDVDRDETGVMEAVDGDYDQQDELVCGVIMSYSTPGVHEICITGKDAAGNEGPEVCALLAVYDPSGGFVTGGGWIWSPAGAYVDDPLLEGKANFGFVSKYKKGATEPTGNTEFVFQAADLKFHSSSYQWLVVNQAGTNAQFKGSGTINGAGDYKFMLWAGDDSPDTFRIKIWTEDEAGNEAVVYDNVGDQEIGGGSIVVHAK
jgi:hypothetical protein